MSVAGFHSHRRLCSFLEVLVHAAWAQFMLVELMNDVSISPVAYTEL